MTPRHRPNDGASDSVTVKSIPMNVVVDGRDCVVMHDANVILSQSDGHLQCQSCGSKTLSAAE